MARRRGLALAQTTPSREADEERLPGWKGETYDHQKSNVLFGYGEPGRQSVAKDAVGRAGFGGVGFKMWRQAGSAQRSPTESWIETVSWAPRALVYHNFLTPEECDHLIGLATPSLERSTVIDASTGQAIADDVRTSFGTFIQRGEDEIVRSIETRIAAFTHLPVENGENIQVLRYDKGQVYGKHYDYFEYIESGKLGNNANGGQRKATVLMYLETVEDGGETVFPDSTWASDALKSQQAAEAAEGLWSKCGARGVAAKPKKGDALLFFSLDSDNVPDSQSLHEGCPPLSDGQVKWTATKWIHVSEFHAKAVVMQAPPGVCADLHEACADWARQGECDANPAFMKGSKSNLPLLIQGAGGDGQCRYSCHQCAPQERVCASQTSCVGGALVSRRGEDWL